MSSRSILHFSCDQSLPPRLERSTDRSHRNTTSIARTTNSLPLRSCQAKIDARIQLCLHDSNSTDRRRSLAKHAKQHTRFNLHAIVRARSSPIHPSQQSPSLIVVLLLPLALVSHAECTRAHSRSTPALALPIHRQPHPLFSLPFNHRFTQINNSSNNNNDHRQPSQRHSTLSSSLDAIVQQPKHQSDSNIAGNTTRLPVHERADHDMTAFFITRQRKPILRFTLDNPTMNTRKQTTCHSPSHAQPQRINRANEHAPLFLE